MLNHTAPQAVEAQVHNTATVDATASLAPGVVVGPGALVGPHCEIGARTRIDARAIVVEHTSMGADNRVHAGAVIGGDPQDRKFDPRTPGRLIIGDSNVFREHVTISRGTGDEHPTRIGSRCYFMASSHVGHNCVVGDGVTMVNGSSLGGHVRVDDGAFLSADCGVHQFCAVGELVMFQVGASLTMHAPPFVMLGNGLNRVAGINKVGIARSNRFSREEQVEIKEIFRLFYRGREERTLSKAIEEADGRQWGKGASIFLDFVRRSIACAPPRHRGICGPAWQRAGGRAQEAAQADTI